jgi:putative glutamine amidotransferase
LIPALGDIGSHGRLDLQGILWRLDGVLLTGGKSMIEPWRYGGHPSRPDALHDPARDSTTLALARHAVAMGIPLLGICRGFQELCCAFGAQLEQELGTWSTRVDHLRRCDEAYADRYLPAHEVRCTPGGVLESIAARVGEPQRLCVNSLHRQGVTACAAPLVVEAVSEDGLVEAARVSSSRSMALGVQWHAEWHHESTPINRALFVAFGEACRHHFGDRWTNPGPSGDEHGWEPGVEAGTDGCNHQSTGVS